MYSAASSGLANSNDAIVEDNHTPVVGAHDLFEVVVAEVLPAERLRDLLVVEVDLVDAVDADHRGQLGDRDVLLAAHHVGDDVADLVVHQRHAGPVGGRADPTVNCAHAVTSFGVSRPRSPSRLLEAARASGRRSPRSGRPSRRAATRSAAGCGAALTACGVYVVEPALHRRLVRGAVLRVVGEHLEQRARAALLARRVGLAGAHDRRGHEVALRRGGLHHEARAEQLADQRLEDDRGGEERLRPVADAGQALDQLARRLPDRVLLPGLLVDRALEALDLLADSARL